MCLRRNVWRRWPSARRETNSWRWAAFMFTYMMALAYVAAFITYRVALALGGG
jgi:ferrous iron transport protein B